MNRLIFSILFAFLMLAAVIPAQAQETTAKQAIVIDYNTGYVLYEKNADERMAPSSMTKVMTTYLAFDAVDQGRITLDQTFHISEKAWKTGGSRMFVQVGTDVKVEDLLRGVIVQSGNDATVALAEGLAGSEEAFAQAMNQKAKELGMTNSKFKNSHGLNEEGHYSTARDLATLAIRSISDHPKHYHYHAEKEFTYNNIKQGNRNPLLYRNIGADGLKTGHTDAGGYGLIGTAINDKGRRVVVVVNGLGDEQERADQSAQLINWAMNGFEDVTLFKAGDIVEQAEVVLGKQATVPLTVEKDIRVPVPVSFRNDLKVEVVYNGPLQAPVKKGAVVGALKISVPRVKNFEVPLIAAADVERIGLFAGTFAKVLMLLDGSKDR
ncbi:MAG: D-alanyl-D-alanine carboxypeptidase [Micavibrio aeruginosavorus]|uniref:serine-type D-Ala-D-Ala carboxypeptidase n=1 Tax=Micavibrio aeruginosavorus TaxID=349221 RepID=A0A7T5R0U3_9BACT|nr:MAG: D-alanyl-D-alanine carboxypeptidase [Micavibrio aeruginosavorus]